MLNKTLSLLLIFSLAFNIAFAGIWVHNRSTGAPSPAPAPGPPTDAARAPMPGAPSWRQVGLRGPQERQITQGWREAHQKIEAVNAQTHEQREKLFDLLAADELDQEAIATCQQRIEAGQQAARKLALEQMVKTRETLTPEQRARWMRMMKAAGQRHSRRRRQAGPRPGGPERPRREAPGSSREPRRGASQQQNPRGSIKLFILC